MSNAPILLSTEFFDNATIVDGAEPFAWFPIANIQDPQPRKAWRPGSTPFFIADFGSESLISENRFDAAAILFHNIPSSDDASNPPNSGNFWRIQTGNTASGTGLFDSNWMLLWDFPLETPWTDYRSPMFYAVSKVAGGPLAYRTTGGAHSPVLFENDVTGFRYMRVDIAVAALTGPEPDIQIGRFVVGKALQPLVTYGSGIPTPNGSPAKLVNSWDIWLHKAELESIVYALSFSAGSSPRILRSWGYDTHLLDGARTVVMINNVKAPDPWTRHQGTVYGYIESLEEITIDGPDLYKCRITVRGM